MDLAVHQPALSNVNRMTSDFKVVAVKKLVVGSQVPARGSLRGAYCPSGPTRRCP